MSTRNACFSWLYIELYTVNDTYGHIDILLTGEASVASIPLSNAQAYTSLAEISFPAAHVIYIPVNGDAFSASALRVEPSGRLHVFGGLARSLASLGGVSWPVAKFRTHKLRLINGWKSGQKHYGTGDPAYSVANGMVYLSGALLQPGAGSGKIAGLPRAARPAHYLYIKVYSLNDSLSAIKIAPNGTVLVFSLIPSDARGFTSLAGISYPVNS